MKESTFIELLNLYIDQQISPAEATRLEEEILHNPRRRLVYQQYCKMHRACTIVLGNYGAEAEGETVVEFKPEPRSAWGYVAAGLAAACIAVVAARVYVQSGKVAAPSLPAAVPVAMAPAPVAAPAVESLPVRLNAPLPGLRRLGNATSLDQGLVFPLPTYGGNTPSLVMLQTPATRVPLRPLAVTGSPATATPSSIEQFVFQPDAPVLDEPQVFRVRRTADGKEEMTAYQFQR